jgi:hypothetical protein
MQRMRSQEHVPQFGEGPYALEEQEDGSFVVEASTTRDMMSMLIWWLLFVVSFSLRSSLMSRSEARMQCAPAPAVAGVLAYLPGTDNVDTQI